MWNEFEVLDVQRFRKPDIMHFAAATDATDRMYTHRRAQFPANITRSGLILDPVLVPVLIPTQSPTPKACSDSSPDPNAIPTWKAFMHEWILKQPVCLPP